MESGTAVFETIQNPGASPDSCSPFYSECLSTALELLEILEQEARILRRFAGDELLTLIPKKEYLVSELEWKLESARNSGADNYAVSDDFKALISEINKLNTSNGVFIEKSLSYWQDLLAIFLPPSYGPTGKASRRVPSSPRGVAFSREV